MLKILTYFLGSCKASHNHEQAVEDVLTEYEQGSTLLMKNLEKAHQEDRRRIQNEVDKLKRTMIYGHIGGTSRDLANQQSYSGPTST